MAKGKESSTRGGRRRLGRGLDSLLKSPVKVDVPSDASTEARPSSSKSGEIQASVNPSLADPNEAKRAEAEAGTQLRMIPIEKIRPNPHQPRREFSPEALDELASSIRSAGLMQPLVVRIRRDESDPDGGVELIAGERRWRAAKIIGLSHVPAVIHDVSDQVAAEWALIENVQRKDLTPLERAEAFLTLYEQFSLSHQDIAERVGLQRATVSNHLRLLELDPRSREALARGEIDMGHARALLGVTDVAVRLRLVDRTISEGWSVRALERAIRESSKSAKGGDSAATHAPARVSPSVADLESRLSAHLGTKVAIRPGRKKGSGKVTIDFFSFDEFEGLLRRMGFDPDRDS